MLVAVDAMDFHFESTCTTPYMSAPSSPRRFGHGGGDYYFSAPTSPARASAIYQEFNNSTQRFNWDESIENPKSRDTHDEEDDDDADFAFDFGVQLDKTSLSADELFHGGKIKPLLQPQTQTTNRFSQIDYDEFNKSRNRKSPISSPRSPTNHQGKKIHPFNNKPPMRGEEQDRGRGRTMTSSSSSSKSNRRESRSLSPLRIAEFAWEEEQQLQLQQQQSSSKPTSATDGGAVIASSGSLKGSKKWSFKDLLLFRSASEGRASDKDPLRKYTAAAAAMATTKRSSTNEGDEKNGSSFRSTDSNPGSRKKGPVSAHELHYKVNRAVSEESRRKTYLPYKPRLFGFLGFNPTVHSQRF